MRFSSILIIIIFNISYLFSQDTKKLSKKDANEEVKRLTILIEELESEKEELNNKLMIEYEKLLSEMDENSNLRIQNGEFRSEVREMQKNVIELQKSLEENKSLLKFLEEKNNKLTERIKSDSLNNIQLLQSFKKLEQKRNNDSLIINQLNFDLENIKLNKNQKKLKFSLESAYTHNNEEVFAINNKGDFITFSNSIIQSDTFLIEDFYFNIYDSKSKIIISWIYTTGDLENKDTLLITQGKDEFLKKYGEYNFQSIIDLSGEITSDFNEFLNNNNFIPTKNIIDLNIQLDEKFNSK